MVESQRMPLISETKVQLASFEAMIADTVKTAEPSAGCS